MWHSCFLCFEELPAVHSGCTLSGSHQAGTGVQLLHPLPTLLSCVNIAVLMSESPADSSRQGGSRAPPALARTRGDLTFCSSSGGRLSHPRWPAALLLGLRCSRAWPWTPPALMGRSSAASGSP